MSGAHGWLSVEPVVSVAAVVAAAALGVAAIPFGLVGWAAIEAVGRSSPPPSWAMLAVLAAVLIRCGSVPAH